MENTNEDINEDEMATKKGCLRQGKKAPKTSGGKCVPKKKTTKKRLISKKSIRKFFG